MVDSGTPLGATINSKLKANLHVAKVCHKTINKINASSMTSKLFLWETISYAV